MSKSVIIIPTRLESKRLPNKPLLKINNVPMIIHVMKKAKESGVGDVIVATPDKKIFDLVKKNYGKAIITNKKHFTGTDRIHEALNKLSDDIDIVINLQGDMPNLDPDNIIKLDFLMRKNNCNIGTLASTIQNSNPDKVDVDHIKMSQIKLDTKEFEFIDNKKIKQLGEDAKTKYPSEQK